MSAHPALGELSSSAVLAPIPSVRITKRKKRQNLSAFPETEKKQIKRVNNRLAAQDLRDRKKKYEETLEDRLSLIEQDNSSLCSKMSELEAENKSIRDEIQAFTQSQLAMFRVPGLVDSVNTAVRCDREGSQRQLQDLIAKLTGQLPASDSARTPDSAISSFSGNSPAPSPSSSAASVPTPGLSPAHSVDLSMFEDGAFSETLFDDLSVDALGSLDSLDPMDFALSPRDESVAHMAAREPAPAPVSDMNSSDHTNQLPVAPHPGMAGLGATSEVTGPAVPFPLPSGPQILLWILMAAMQMRLGSPSGQPGPSATPLSSLASFPEALAAVQTTAPSEDSAAPPARAAPKPPLPARHLPNRCSPCLCDDLHCCGDLRCSAPHMACSPLGTSQLACC